MTAEEIRDAVYHLNPPASVREVWVDVGSDSSGESSIVVNLIVKDAGDEQRAADELAEFAWRVQHDLLSRERSNRWPYVRFEPAAEQTA